MLWHKSLPIVIAGAAGFLLVDLAFFSANLTKVVSGGWFPLVIAACVFTVLMTWQRGQKIYARNRAEKEGSLVDFVVELDASDDPPVRVPGTAVFLNAEPDLTPLALRFNVEHNRVLHEQVVIIHVATAMVPHLPPEERFEVDTVVIPDDGIVLVKAVFGFQDRPHIPKLLHQIREETGLPLDCDEPSYFLSRATVAATRGGGMALWRKKLYVSLERNGAGRAAYFGLPTSQVVSFGAEIEI
jgi:KUP system potassium uptake protein